MNNSTRFLMFAAVLTIAATGRALADDGFCAHCGCQADCQKVCRLVCEEKKVDVVCWGCKCEDFCVPGRSKPGCRHCETVCDDCESRDSAVPRSEPKRFVWLDWMPGRAQIYTRTKLMRKTETVTVPSYKWVVEDMCSTCANKQADMNAALVAEMPTQPDAAKSR